MTAIIARSQQLLITLQLKLYVADFGCRLVHRIARFGVELKDIYTF